MESSKETLIGGCGLETQSQQPVITHIAWCHAIEKVEVSPVIPK